MNIPIFAVASITALTVAVPALSRPYQTTERASSPGTYQVTFIDDPLDALDHGIYIARVRVRPGPARTLLLRPRASFVQEMLKSVESSE